MFSVFSIVIIIRGWPEPRPDTIDGDGLMLCLVRGVPPRLPVSNLSAMEVARDISAAKTSCPLVLDVKVTWGLGHSGVGGCGWPQ